MNLQEIDLKNVYRRWKADLGSFQGFFRSTPFVSLQTYDDFELNEEIKTECDKEVLNKILEKCSEDDFLIIDLPFDEILDLALVLNNEHSIKPILNVNLLFHPFGMVGSIDNINKLINYGLKLKKIDTNKFVMLFQYDRYDEALEGELLCDKLNNQYGIGEDDFPYSKVLKQLGYNKVVIITKNKIKKDLNEYIKFIIKDIKVEIVRVN